MDPLPSPSELPDELPLGDELGAAPQSLLLTPDQLAALGLEDCPPGETYTIQIEAGEAGDDAGRSFNVLSSEPDTAPDGEPPIDMLPTEQDAEVDEPLGYTRKKKEPREGLPDTKRLRDL